MLGAAVLVQVLRRGAGDDLGPREPACHEVAVERAPAEADDADVEVLVDGLHRPRCRQLHRDLRVQRMEARQMLGQLVHREVRRRQHAQVPARLAARGAGERLGFFDLGEDQPRALQVGLADVGEGEPARRAVDEPCAEMLFEVRHQPRHDGRRQVHLTCCCCEAARVDDPAEDAHRVQPVHVDPPDSFKNRNTVFDVTRFIDRFAMPTVHPIPPPCMKEPT